MYKKGEIKSVAEAIEIAKEHEAFWYRGHSETYNNLTPGVFREEYANHTTLDPEKNFVDRFKHEAPSLASHIPIPDMTNPLAAIEWLLLMQHYELPTRLLDWTENILVALYFTVYKKNNEAIMSDNDGELWVFAPKALNGLTGQPGLSGAYGGKVTFLANEKHYPNTGELRKFCGIQDGCSHPVAFLPIKRFSRMVSQFSVFTIHPDPNHGGNTIEGLFNFDEGFKYLKKYTIPKDCKKNIAEELKYSGIRQHILFPELDSLSAYLKQDVIKTQKA